MSETSLKFGTSGLRGLAAELAGPPAFTYATAFLEVLAGRGQLQSGGPVAIGRDLRDTSPEIVGLVAAAIVERGFEPLDCGALPTPALAHFANSIDAPAIMVTGSHIPEDRNGLKFYRPDGEIDKEDEASISRRIGTISAPATIKAPDLPTTPQALAQYERRYREFLAADVLRGLRVGVYQHSSVGRDLIVRVLEELGAEVTALARSDRFVPVDTEALRPEDIALLAEWGQTAKFDAIVSTDGDADRPLITDEAGRFVRGDLVGALTSRWLGARTIVVPVTANSALEASGAFGSVVRTRVGSPYVIEAIQREVSNNSGAVVGFEANGGVLLGTAVAKEGRQLEALPTRDALLPILAILCSMAERQQSLSKLSAEFGFRSAVSNRLTNIPAQASAAFMSSLNQLDAVPDVGPIVEVTQIDGTRLVFGNGEIMHFRASGNAPELRCYVEADDEERAHGLLRTGLAFARQRIENQEIR